MVQTVLFDNQVEIVVESIFHSFLDSFSELGWEVIRSKLAIRQFKLAHPDVRLVESCSQELIE